MRENTINIRHLRAFSAVVECKGISKATEKVYLSQPAITQAIAKLESTLNTVLFDRKSTGMYPTHAGEILVHRVTRALNILLEGVRDALKYGGGGKKGTSAASILNLMTTTQLKALIAISASNSFSRASREIGVSQSSLHRSGRDLENLLGVVLFEKTSFGISPKKSAMVLTRAAKLAFSEIDQAQEEIRFHHHIEVGHMKIGSMPLARTSILPCSIIDFTRRHPEFQFTISDGPYDDLLSHLRFGDIDILIGALRFPLPREDVVQETLFSSSVVIVARPDHPLMQQSEVTLSTLQKGTWVVPHEGAPTRTIFENLFMESGYPAPERLIESNSHVLIRTMLQEGDYMTLISEHQVQQELDTGLLAIVPYTVQHAYRPIGITTRKNWQPTASQQQFIDILKQRGAAIGHVTMDV